MARRLDRAPSEPIDAQLLRWHVCRQSRSTHSTTANAMSAQPSAVTADRCPTRPMRWHVGSTECRLRRSMHGRCESARNFTHCAPPNAPPIRAQSWPFALRIRPQFHSLRAPKRAPNPSAITAVRAANPPAVSLTARPQTRPKSERLDRVPPKRYAQHHSQCAVGSAECSHSRSTHNTADALASRLD